LVPLEKLVSVGLMREMMNKGQVRAYPSPVVGCSQYTRITNVRPVMWNQATILASGAGIVCEKEGMVVARSMSPVLELNTDGFPETHESHIPNYEATMTCIEDGEHAILGPDQVRPKVPIIFTAEGVHDPLSFWATGYYRNHFEQTAKWPEGYTPQFSIRHPRKQYLYGQEAFTLIGLVHIQTGTEVPLSELQEWADRNKMPCVKAVDEEGADFGKGVVYSWDIPGTGIPLKIAIHPREHLRSVQMARTVSKRLIWGTCKARGQYFRKMADDPTLPPLFRRWITMTADEFEMRYNIIAKEVEDAAKAIPDGLVEMIDRKRWVYDNYGQLVPVLHAYLDGGERWKEFAWDAVRPPDLLGNQTYLT
jgi:hypothetical protein